MALRIKPRSLASSPRVEAAPVKQPFCISSFSSACFASSAVAFFTCLSLSGVMVAGLKLSDSGVCGTDLDEVGPAASALML
eukprot:7574121-Pyramimonas_sp.AAC.1